MVMDRAELRALDSWIAENFFNRKRPIYTHEPHIDPIEDGVWVCAPTYSHHDNCEWLPWRFTTDASACSVVRREMEHRGWSWTCECELIPSLDSLEPRYTFEIIMSEDCFGDPIDSVIEYGESENLACCLAVKAALGG